jgi:hypothetical protein
MRLKQHIESRIEKVEKHDHWCWSFVRKNLYRAAAIMLMMGHVRSDLDCSSSKVSLLSDSTSSFVLVGTGEISKLEGCYLYKDPHCGFIRSEKTVGRSFADRHKEHARCALSQDTRSRFYTRYPAKNADYSKQLRHGFFDSLQQYCGLGFSRNASEAYKNLYRTDGGGILVWEPRVLAEIKARSKNGQEQEKRLHLVGYLFELCYDLALSTNNNVSQNPGFESFLGEYGGGSK